jgi:hypothetical protein
MEEKEKIDLLYELWKFKRNNNFTYSDLSLFLDVKKGTIESWLRLGHSPSNSNMVKIQDFLEKVKGIRL